MTESKVAAISTTTLLASAVFAMTVFHTHKAAQALKNTLATVTKDVVNIGHYPQLLYLVSAAAYATFPIVYYLIR